ncbi:MAG: filamentous hemagglutinin N-terminal domain-containing protein, partial [Desulfovibrionaceae bacterium]|nr:filamentous hemagglutinin N-terminal domain-containing protein [Desulfovibrionaceae bacterium]
MNKNLHRIIFNAARGMRMAVQETAKSTGKTAAARQSGLGAALAALLTSTSVPAQIISAPNVPANQRPTVLAAPNGVPLVNIQTPSAAGVSRNVYRQFDVQSQGAILNNARKDTQTQLGGWVQGNPWLATGSARVILGEVNSSNPSQLGGYIEVGGQRAEVIIANPAGIQVDGGGFINASGVTLATGTVQLGADGAINGYRVQGGSIGVGGQGLNASDADYTRLLARAAQINAGIWANDLAVVLGSNSIANTSGSLGAMPVVTPVAAIPGAGTPVLALDVGQLGGMYAGKIFLVGTEAGLGARNAGALNASAGQVQISLDGRLSSSGAIAAAQDIDLSVQGLNNSGAISSPGDIVIADSGADSSNSGSLTAARQLHYSSNVLNNQNGGVLSAERLDIQAQSLANAGTIEQTGAQELAIQADRLSNTGQSAVIGAPLAAASGGGTSGESGGDTDGGMASKPDTPDENASTGGTGSASGGIQVLPAGQISAQRLSNSGRILANGVSDLSVEQSLSNSGTLNLRALSADGSVDNSQGTVMVQSWRGEQTSLVNRDGSFYSATDLNLQSQRLDNTGGQIGTAGSLTANVQQDIVNAGGAISGAGDTRLSAQSLDNSQGGQIVSNYGSVSLSVAQSLNNQGGDIHTVSADAGKTLTIQAGFLDNTGGHISQAGSGAMQVTTSGTLTNVQGELISNGSLGIKSGDLVNDGGLIVSQGAASLNVASLSNRSGNLQAGGGDAPGADLNVQSAGAIDNTGGSMSASRDVSIQAQSLDNARGSIFGGSTLTIATAGAIANDAGQLRSNGELTVSGGELSNKGGVIASSADNALLDVTVLDNTGGSVSAGGQLDIRAQSLDNTQGQITQAGAGTMRLQVAGLLTSTHGQIVSNDGLDLNAGQFDNSQGALSAQGDLALSVPTLDNTDGLLQSGGRLTLTSAGAVMNTGGRLHADGDLRLASGLLANGQGVIDSGANATIDTGALGNTDGVIAAQNTVTLATQALDNTGGQIGGESVELDTHGQSFINDDGQIIAAGDLRIGSGALSNQGGLLQAG